MISKENGSTIIDLLRHGEPQGGMRIRGWVDDPLSELGWSQMRSAVDGASGWEVIITSPLVRCARYAAELGERLGVEVMVEERMAELGFGEWEGRPAEELLLESPDAVRGFWSNPVEHPPPGGESLHRFHRRVTSAWHEIVQEHAGRHLLLVGHGGVNRLIIGEVLGMPLSHLFRMEIPFAGVSRIRIQNGLPRLVFHCGSLT